MNEYTELDITQSLKSRLKAKWRKFKRRWNRHEADHNLREALEELIEEGRESEHSFASDERELLGNVLNLRDLTASDVMTPRADIIAVPVTSDGDTVIGTMIKHNLNFLPVHRENLDDIIGVIYIKDILAWMQKKQPLNVRKLIRPVLFIAPSMRTLDLLFKMRESGTKIALVVDEYGGIDGLVTFADLIEEIIGDIQDAQDRPTAPQIIERPDKTVVADARVPLEEVEERLNLDLRLPELGDDIDSLGGLVVALLGRVPIRGELINHPTGVEFEIVDADPRRVKRLCLRNLEQYKPLSFEGE